MVARHGITGCLGLYIILERHLLKAFPMKNKSSTHLIPRSPPKHCWSKVPSLVDFPRPEDSPARLQIWGSSAWYYLHIPGAIFYSSHSRSICRQHSLTLSLNNPPSKLRWGLRDIDDGCGSDTLLKPGKDGLNMELCGVAKREQRGGTKANCSSLRVLLTSYISRAHLTIR
jgi:hypothetical protein